MDRQERMNLFNDGDLVAFKVDIDDISSAKKYAVVGKSNDKIVISDKGKTSEVSPFELLTHQEFEDADKKAWYNLNNSI